ncbi:MAG: hypothetical protein M1335_04505, partial [Chloroflexi bacterium]|nr:hypothetical protein [Chloroflexota bacterium]
MPMINLPPAKLKEILVKAGAIDAAVFDTLATEAEHKRQSLAEIIISQGIVNSDYFYLLLSRALGVERVNLGAVG